ncbi:hypothetical protein [Streptomyces sp. NPDC091217]|uniref:hypothetical protein n=1 Tax=Streptomyces sp. NPDC091217 TaxID=3365975 RepID=UPI003828F95F
MIERHEIENDLLGEIADHFTSCGDDQSSYAGLVIDGVRHERGSVVLTGHERASRAVFTAAAYVRVLVDPARPSPTSAAVDGERHSDDGVIGGEPRGG